MGRTFTHLSHLIMYLEDAPTSRLDRKLGDIDRIFSDPALEPSSSFDRTKPQRVRSVPHPKWKALYLRSARSTI